MSSTPDLPVRATVVLGSVALVAAFVLLLSSGSDRAQANPLGGVIAVGLGGVHSCAVTTDGGLSCWGLNDHKQLGAPTSELCGSDEHACSTIPLGVTGLGSGVEAVAGREFHTCALTSAGGVKCWGSNQFGALGDGTRTGRQTPTDVVGLASGVRAIAAGTGHTCALTDLGGVKCWGFGGGSSSLTPVDIVGVTSGVAAISAGGDFTCALTDSGGVKCWGSIAGLNTSSAADIAGLESGVVAIAGGGTHACAVNVSGGVKCWGSNFQGELGDGTTNKRFGATDVVGLASGITAIAAATGQTCALTSSGGVKCWGSNPGSQQTVVPVNVAGLASGATGIAAGENHACALTVSNGLKCWGGNAVGQLGDGTTRSSAIPVDVVEFAAKPTATPTPCPVSGCPTATPTPICPAPTCMSLTVTGTRQGRPATCDSDVVAKCSLDLGSGFTMEVIPRAIPPDGYGLWATLLDYGALEHIPAPLTLDEVSWDLSFVSVRFHDDRARLLSHGDISGFFPPLALSTQTTALVTLQFKCSTSGTLRLIDYDENPSGTAFGGGERGVTIFVPDVGQLDVNCVEPPVGGIALDPDPEVLAARRSPALSGERSDTLASLLAAFGLLAGAALWARRRQHN